MSQESNTIHPPTCDHNLVDFSYMLELLELRSMTASHFIPSQPFLDSGGKWRSKLRQECSIKDCITCNAWTSWAADSYVSITAHYLTEDWWLMSLIQNVCNSTVVHTCSSIHVDLGCPISLSASQFHFAAIKTTKAILWRFPPTRILWYM